MKKPDRHAPAHHQLAGAALLLLVACVHLGYQPIGDRYADPIAAGRAAYYVLRGAEGAALYAAVWWLSGRSVIVTIACAWGIAESAQAAACRLALGLGNPPVPEAGCCLCDRALGVPVGAVMAVLALIGASIAQESLRAPKPPPTTEPGDPHARR